MIITHSPRRRLRTGAGLSEWRRRCGAAVLTAALSTPALGAPPDGSGQLDRLPELGDYSASVLSAREEEKLGRQFIREARRRVTFVEDPELKQYLSDLGQRLAVNSDAPEQRFHFYLIEDQALNAFAVPGGHIALHTGLILNTRSEAELASVLAHELAHITQRHLPRMLADMKQHSLPAAAAIIAAILLGGQAGQAALLATNASLIERQLKYSRDFEREADTIGIHVLARSGFDARAMPIFFERLQQWSRVQESNAPEFLRTHPLTANRIAEAAARAERYPQPAPADDEQFLHVQAKIRALYGGDAQAATTHFAAVLADVNEVPAVVRYGYALALMASSQYRQAQDQIHRLRELHPQRLSYLLAEAAIAMAGGDAAGALRLYRTAQQQHPGSIMVDIYTADALINTGDHQGAKRVIRGVIRQGEPEPRLYAMLARAEGGLNNSLGAHQALAEFHDRMGNQREALRQLRLARNYVGNSFYATASIDARIAEIEQKLRLSGEKVGPK